MKKLLELLNEFEKENGRNFEVTEIGMSFRNNDLMVISKRYGFIKRLVDNDKIDLEKVKNIKLPIDTKLRAKVDEDEKTCLNRLYTLKLLMLLAISDTTIEDLISYLK